MHSWNGSRLQWACGVCTMSEREGTFKYSFYHSVEESTEEGWRDFGAFFSLLSFSCCFGAAHSLHAQIHSIIYSWRMWESERSASITGSTNSTLTVDAHSPLRGERICDVVSQLRLPFYGGVMTTLRPESSTHSFHSSMDHDHIC